MAGYRARRHQHGVEADVASSAAATTRRFCRSVTDSAASSSRTRAFTSTNTSTRRRRATMSISPTGLFQRRATMR
jgi:hypothetical protein